MEDFLSVESGEGWGGSTRKEEANGRGRTGSCRRPADHGRGGSAFGLRRKGENGGLVEALQPAKCATQAEEAPHHRPLDADLAPPPMQKPIIIFSSSVF